jgi:hypothetical protein
MIDNAVQEARNLLLEMFMILTSRQNIVKLNREYDTGGDRCYERGKQERDQKFLL